MKLIKELNLGNLSKILTREVPAWDIEVKTDPYPYFIADNVIDGNVLQEMHRNWPSRSSFKPEVGGNYVCDLIEAPEWDSERNTFWLGFMEGPARTVIAKVLSLFKTWIEKRYGDPEIFLANVSLMEADHFYKGHGVHTHHYHDPCWVATLLLYLDEPNGCAGTTINRHVSTDIQNRAVMAANTMGWFNDPALKEVATAEYKPNRLFAMLDSPISYHSVKPSLSTGRRRIFRVHLKAGEEWFEKLYGVGRAEYTEMRAKPTTDPRVIEWMKRDIEQL